MNALENIMQQFKGKSADEIAEVLGKRRIKGRLGTTYGCPMALLLDGVGSGTYVVGRKYIVRRSGNKLEKMRTPEQVAVFLRKFDLGKYPSLIAPPPRCLNKSRPKRVSGPSGPTSRKPIENHIAKLVGRFDDRKSA